MEGCFGLAVVGDEMVEMMKQMKHQNLLKAWPAQPSSKIWMALEPMAQTAVGCVDYGPVQRLRADSGSESVPVQ